MEVTSDRRYHFAAPPQAVWEGLSATSSFRDWWPWLRELDAAGLVEGDTWRCVVRPPLPYVLRFTIRIDELVLHREVSATVEGDIAGPARLDLSPLGDGTELRLRSAMSATSRAFSVVARLATPLVRRGHDWVLDTGAAQFADRALI